MKPLSPANPGRVVLDVSERERVPDPYRRVNVVTARTTIRYGVDANGTVFVTYSEANHYKGRARRYGESKTFSRWATDLAVRVSAKPGEPWRVHTYSTGRKGRPGGWRYSTVFADGTGTRQIPWDLLDKARNLLPPAPTTGGHYPLLRHYMSPAARQAVAGPYGDPATAWAPAAVRRAFVDTTDVQELTRRLFGKTRYRRDLVKAVANTNMNTLALAWQFRGLVPIDWIIDLMRASAVPDGARPWPNIRPHLRVLDRQSLRNLLNDVADARSHRLINDIARMPVMGRPMRVRTWKHLHDTLVDHMLLYRNALTQSGKKKRPVPLPEYATALAGDIGRGVEIELATHEDDLWSWALRMHHCIGGYGPELRSGRHLLGAVSVNGAIAANFEILHWEENDEPHMRLRQLLGHSNTLVPEPLRGTVVAHMETAGVTVPKTYWGSAPTELTPAA